MYAEIDWEKGLRGRYRRSESLTFAARFAGSSRVCVCVFFSISVLVCIVNRVFHRTEVRRIILGKLDRNSIRR